LGRNLEMIGIGNFIIGILSIEINRALVIGEVYMFSYLPIPSSIMFFPTCIVQSVRMKQPITNWFIAYYNLIVCTKFLTFMSIVLPDVLGRITSIVARFGA